MDYRGRAALAALVVATLGVAFAATSVGQGQPKTSVRMSAKVSPMKAGTTRHPQGMKVEVDVDWSSEAGVEPPIITAATVYIPRHGLYNGGKYPTCSISTLNRGGPGACPKHSIMGTATASAYADTVITHPTITIVNGGARAFCLYTVLTNPARVQACVPAKVTKLSHDPDWQYRVDVAVPEVLQIVASVPIALRDFHFTAGAKPYAREWLANTGCPRRNYTWSLKLETEYLYQDGTTSRSQSTDTNSCIPANYHGKLPPGARRIN